MFVDTDQRNICIDSLLQLKVFNDPDDTQTQNINYFNCKKYCESNDDCKMCIVDKFDSNNKNRIVAFGIQPNKTIIQSNDYPIKNCSNTISTYPSEQSIFYKSPPHDIVTPDVSHAQLTMMQPVTLQATPLPIAQATPLQSTKPFCDKIDLNFCNNLSKFKKQRTCHSRYSRHSCKYKKCNKSQVVLI